MSEKKTILFIPEISGFTQFVNDTEIQHSQHINEELLELILKLNDLALRTRWLEDLVKITYDDKKIPRSGSTHLCDLSAGLVELETVKTNGLIIKLSMLSGQQRFLF